MTTSISALPAGAALDGTEVLPVDQSGTTVKVTTQAIANLTPIVENTTLRTLSAVDNGHLIYFTNGSNITLNMAGSLGVFSCAGVQEGAGQIVFTANGQTMTVAGGLTKTASAGATFLIVSRVSGTFYVSGTLA